jgi:hypothetical protein
MDKTQHKDKCKDINLMLRFLCCQVNLWIFSSIKQRQSQCEDEINDKDELNDKDEVKTEAQSIKKKNAKTMTSSRKRQR